MKISRFSWWIPRFLSRFTSKPNDFHRQPLLISYAVQI